MNNLSNKEEQLYILPVVLTGKQLLNDMLLVEVLKCMNACVRENLPAIRDMLDSKVVASTYYRHDISENDRFYILTDTSGKIVVSLVAVRYIEEAGKPSSSAFIIYTHPEYRRIRLAHSLLMQYHQDEKKAHRVMYINVVQSNIAAVKLYESLGYRSFTQLMIKLP